MTNQKQKTKYLLYGVMIIVPMYLIILILVQITLPIKLMVAFVLFSNLLFFVELIDAYQLKKVLSTGQLLYEYNQQVDLFIGVITGSMNLLGIIYSFAFTMNSTVLLVLVGITVVATVMVSSHRLYITNTKLYTGYFTLNLDEIESVQIKRGKKVFVFIMKNGVKYDLRVYMNFQDHLTAINRYIDVFNSE